MTRSAATTVGSLDRVHAEQRGSTVHTAYAVGRDYQTASHAASVATHAPEIEVVTASVRSSYVAHVNESERAALLHVHRELAAASLSRELTRSERCRLALVRWELDRIRDAELGPSLDAWREIAEGYEALERQIETFANQATAATRRRPRRPARP